MKKIDTGCLIASLVGAVLLIGAALGLTYLYKRINGTTKAQIEAYERGKELVDKSAESIHKSAEWYNQSSIQLDTLATNNN